MIENKNYIHLIKENISLATGWQGFLLRPLEACVTDINSQLRLTVDDSKI
jgi:hypothetical protein